MVAAVANLAGFADGFSEPAARAAGVWVFAAALPIAALACLTAWRLGSLRPAPHRGGLTCYDLVIWLSDVVSGVDAHFRCDARRHDRTP